MANVPHVSEVRAFNYEVLVSGSDDQSGPLAYLTITENRKASDEGALDQAEREYGFSLASHDGTVLAEVSTGYLAFFLAVLGKALPLHGQAVMDDSDPTQIRTLEVEKST